MSCIIPISKAKEIGMCPQTSFKNSVIKPIKITINLDEIKQIDEKHNSYYLRQVLARHINKA